MIFKKTSATTGFCLLENMQFLPPFLYENRKNYGQKHRWSLTEIHKLKTRKKLHVKGP